MSSLNQPGAGSLQEEFGPHPPTPSLFPWFLSLLQLINLSVFPYSKSSLLHKLVSVRISHLSSKNLLPLPLLWLVQSKSASAGDWLPTNKANHSDMKGKQPQMNKECVCFSAHVCTYMCKYQKRLWPFMCVCLLLSQQACFRGRVVVCIYRADFCGIPWGPCALHPCFLWPYMTTSGMLYVCLYERDWLMDPEMDRWSRVLAGRRISVSCERSWDPFCLWLCLPRFGPLSVFSSFVFSLFLTQMV